LLLSLGARLTRVPPIALPARIPLPPDCRPTSTA
jgi:hypothetical protein